MTMLISERILDLTAVQTQVEKNLVVPTRHTGVHSTIFELIMEYDDAVVEFGLGPLGQVLKSFAKVVDPHHATVIKLHEGVFIKDSKLYSQIAETLVLAGFARTNGLNTMPQEIRDLFNFRYASLIKTLRRPPASILKNPELRAKARSEAEQKVLDIPIKQEEWESIWPSFKPFVRLGEGFRDQIEYNMKIVGRLKDMQASATASKLLRQNEALKKTNEDSYCGFLRLKPDEAASILAKIHNFSWVESLGRIGIPFESLKTEISHSRTAEFSLYEARAYPVSKCPFSLPPKTQSIINAIESHPDANNKPLFDRYWVIVPGVSLAVGRGNYTFIKDGQTARSDDYWEAHRAMDATMVENGDICPVLLGENLLERKCYFVSYVI